MLPVLLDPAKFKDALVTAKGEERAHVALRTLETLWFNTGTLCNLTCQNCYIESSPRNDRLAYLSAAEVTAYLDEIERDGHGTKLIGFTGGEPFMNRDLPAMLEDVLSRGLKAMVLTNAMKPMHRMKPALLALLARHGRNLTIRVSLDHYERTLHEKERGARSWKPTIDGLVWLAAVGLRRACRRPAVLRARPRSRCARASRGCSPGLASPIDAHDPATLVAVSRRWTPRSTFRRSPPPAGASCRSRPTA